MIKRCTCSKKGVAKTNRAPKKDEVFFRDLYRYSKLFDEAQKILEARNAVNAKKSSIAYTTRGAALLGGNIFCAHCGCKMHAVSYQDPVILADGTRKVYRGITYICPNRARKRGECTGQTQYKSTKIDEAVLELLHRVFEKIQGKVKDETLKEKYEGDDRIVNA